MKELTIEEKARRYDEALERARKEYKNHEAFKGYCEMLEHIFTKLKEKESEDEKIRKWLITQLELKSDVNNPHDLELMILKSIAWLEKQGEQKPITIDIDKMVSKYSHTKDGDFGLPVNCQIRAYRQGINDALSLSLGIKKQGEQKPYGQREECLDCQFNYEGFCVMKRCEQKPVIEMKSAEESLGIDSDTYNEIVDECIYGEQKPTDKVEPKFKIGDWINGYYTNYKVLSVNNNGYLVEDVDGNKINILFENEEFHHLWTIQDAKDGDVLIYNHQPFKWIFIFKCLYNPILVSYYVMFTEKNKICIDDSISTNFLSKITPATKEQRNLLFQKMKEAGYEWDENNKELKKVDEIEESDFFDDFRNSDVEVDSNEDGLIASTVKYKNEQKQTWNKEDDNCLSTIIAEFSKCAGKSVSKDEWMRCNDFLNSLRDRVQLSPKQEWSEDDENMLKTIFDSLNIYAKNAHPCLKSVIEEEIDWLKSIKSRKLCVYNPYKAVVESIAKMCNKYENCMCDKKEAKDFLANVAIKCREAAEYDKKYMEE